MDFETPPVLSTSVDHSFEAPSPPVNTSSFSRLSEEQLYVQYEIKRTIGEIKAGGWRRIALQLPDEMLVDAPRVFEALRDGLKAPPLPTSASSDRGGKLALEHNMTATVAKSGNGESSLSGREMKLCVLADTSYGACCVDEVAAEHMEADVVVHYGRSCLSPTARLPVVYVFTSKPLDLEAATTVFKQTYENLDEKVVLMADIPYSSHIPELHVRLGAQGFTNVFMTEILHDPASVLPNRTVPEDVKAGAATLQEYSIFHISIPPTSLLLTISSRVKNVHILPTDKLSGPPSAPQATTALILRRRYALITQLATVPIFGILINTLSVKNYMQALSHVQKLITNAGKKSYTFVVGKVNAAKIANFSEIGGWVIIGCWESSLIESKEFYRPLITPFELEVALMDDKERVWGGEWISNFSALLERPEKFRREEAFTVSGPGNAPEMEGKGTGNWDETGSDDEPPEFDLRTGKYVSRTRPMGRPISAITWHSTAAKGDLTTAELPGQSLIKRANGDLASINGAISPAAEFLRSQRTWQGLGSDYEVAYERDEEGKIRGAAMEQGHSGIAKGYSVGEEIEKS